MSRTLSSPMHAELRVFVATKRKEAGLSQAKVAIGLRRPQSYVAHVELGQRRVGVVELMELAAVIGFDPADAIERLKLVGKDPNGKAR